MALRRPSLGLAACDGSGVGVVMVLRSLVRDAWRRDDAETGSDEALKSPVNDVPTDRST